MSTGTVKWFSVARKYGFIVPDEGGKDIFLHMSALNTADITSLDDGARVSFELEEASERRSAVNLALLPALTTPDVSAVPEASPARNVDLPAAAEAVEAVAA
jgi:CspA family cold shock protein